MQTHITQRMHVFAVADTPYAVYDYLCANDIAQPVAQLRSVS